MKKPYELFPFAYEAQAFRALRTGPFYYKLTAPFHRLLLPLALCNKVFAGLGLFLFLFFAPQAGGSPFRGHETKPVPSSFCAEETCGEALQPTHFSYAAGDHKNHKKVLNRKETPPDFLLHNAALHSTESCDRKNPNPEKPFEFARRPTLAFSAPEKAQLTFETDIACTAIVKYGIEGKLDHTLESTKCATEHRFILTGLKHKARYRYRIKAFLGENQVLQGKTYQFDNSLNYTVPSASAILRGNRKLSSPTPYELAAKRIAGNLGRKKGYCLIYGLEEGFLAYELAKQTAFYIIGVENNKKRIHTARRLLHKTGLYGSRITLHHVKTLCKVPFPSSFANLIVSERTIKGKPPPGSAGELVRLLRPYESGAFLGTPQSEEIERLTAKLRAWLEGTNVKYDIEASQEGVWVSITKKAGPSWGSWTHQYGDTANTANSGDSLSGATCTDELQVQWIGPPGADFGLDRNPRMPAPLSVRGRLFHQGMNRVICVDSFNGAFMWLREIPALRRVNIPRDAGNWCADNNSLYVAVKERCWVIDAERGKVKNVLGLPEGSMRKAHDWGYVAQTAEFIFGSSVKKGAIYEEFWGKSRWYDATSGYGTEKVCSDSLFARCKGKGTTAWIYRNGAVINTTLALRNGVLYFVESRNRKLRELETGRPGEASLRRDQFLVALNTATGEIRWERPIDTEQGTVVFYLSCSGKSAIITSSGKGMYHLYAYSLSNGKRRWHASHKWPSDNHGGHMQHPVIAGSTVYLEPCGYDIQTGKRITSAIGHREGCTTYCGTQHALIHRGTDRFTAMWDMETGRESYWRNLRPSCWLSTISADGMILAPEGGGGCSCGRWLETSVAFAPLTRTNPQKTPIRNRTPEDSNGQNAPAETGGVDTSR